MHFPYFTTFICLSVNNWKHLDFHDSSLLDSILVEGLWSWHFYENIKSVRVTSSSLLSNVWTVANIFSEICKSIQPSARYPTIWALNQLCCRYDSEEWGYCDGISLGHFIYLVLSAKVCCHVTVRCRNGQVIAAGLRPNFFLSAKERNWEVGWVRQNSNIGADEEPPRTGTVDTSFSSQAGGEKWENMWG